MTRLYELRAEYESVIREAEDDGGELTAERAARLDAIHDAAPEKVEAIGSVVRDYRLRAEALRAEARRLSLAAQECERFADSLSRYTLEHLKAMGLDRVDGVKFRARVQEGPEAVEVGPEFWMEERGDYIRVQEEPDKEAIKVALKRGAAVPGCRLVRRPVLVWF